MDLIDLLLAATSDPLAYSLIFFIYVILAVVILPIPVEIGLFNPSMHPLLLILLLAVGKGVGALIVYQIGTTIRKRFEDRRPRKKPSLSTRIVKACEKFVQNYGYYGLFIIMSTPLMVDSVSLYLFSLLNPSLKEKRALTISRFVIVNILAGAVRGILILSLAYFVGIRLV